MLTDRQTCLPRIHKVLMENFLSFSRQEVELDPQFSVIVGPNGAGKSSIFQAVKFALGSNDKDSRYPKWSDFIRFNEQYARVELNIIRGAESYSIRRTVFQNGKLTYEAKIPGSSDYDVVPKNEIDDLVGNLGYSTDNIFAFVSQGKIDAIKNMDPHGLCAYLEEGLGLLPVRQKIEHEHDRLQRLQQDMTELGQRKNTYEVELDFLRPKLERLARKREILASVASLKEELMIANRHKTISEIETLKEEKNQNVEALAKVDGLLTEAHEKEEKFDEQVSAIEAELNALFEHAGRKKGDLAIIDGEIKSWEREKQEKIDALRGIDDELKEKQANLTQKEQIEQKIKEKLENTSQVVKELREKHAEIVAEREKIIGTLKKYTEWQVKYTRSKGDLEQKQQQLGELASKISSLSGQSVKLLEKIAHANHQCEVIYKYLNKWGEDFEKNFQSHRSKLWKDIFEQEKVIQDLTVQKNKSLEELSRYERIIAGKDSVYPAAMRQIKAEIKKRNWNVKGPLLEIMQFDPVYAQAIESIFGKAALYSFIVPNRETFILMTQLRKNLRAFCKIFLPKSETIVQFPPLPKHDGVVGYLFDLIKVGGDEEVRKVLRSIVSNTIVVERTSVGLDLHNAGVKARCVNLDGEILIAHKLAEESRPSKDLRAHLSYQQCRMKAEQCQTHITELDDELATETTALQELKEKFARLEKLGQLLPKLQELSKEKEDLSTENHTLNAQKAQLEGQQETAKQSIATLEKEILAMQKDVGIDVIRMQDREKELPAEIEECLNNLNSLLKVKDATSQDYQVAFQAATVARAEFENCQSRKQQISEQIEKSDNQILAKFQELRKTEKDIAKLEHQIEEGKNRKALVLQEKKGCEEIYFNLKIESDRIHAEIQRLEDMITEREQGLRKIMEQLASKPLQDQEQTRPVEEIEEDIAHVLDNLAEYYDVDDHVETRRDEIVESIKRVQNHRGQVEEEMQAAEKVAEALRTEFYSKLSTELTELETRMNERFHNNAVNYRVGLQLGGEFNCLEVKITASALSNPLTPINALSGGQRTMVAINLVLSLQSFNPSPIIIFDEAEMFLDKKNSAVVSKLVGETTSNGVQIIMLMPDSSKGLITLANRVIGVALAGPNGPSTIIPDPHLLNVSPPEE